MERNEHDPTVLRASTPDGDHPRNSVWGPDASPDDAALYRPTQRLPRVPDTPTASAWTTSEPTGAGRATVIRPNDAAAPGAWSPAHPTEITGIDAAIEPIAVHRRALIPILLVAVSSLGAVIALSMLPTHTHPPLTASVTPRVPTPAETTLPSDPLPPLDPSTGPLPAPLPHVTPQPAPTVLNTVFVTPVRPTVTVTSTVVITPSPTPTAATKTPTPEPTPSAQPPPQQPPAQPPAQQPPIALYASWQPAPGAVGPIRLGTPLQAALAQGWVIADPRSPSGFTTAPALAGGLRVNIVAGVVDSVVVLDPGVATAQGVHVNSKVPQLQVVYGPAPTLDALDPSGVPTKLYGTQDATTYLAYPVTGDAVSQIVVGQKHGGAIQLPTPAPGPVQLAAARP